MATYGLPQRNQCEIQIEFNALACFLLCPKREMMMNDQPIRLNAIKQKLCHLSA